MDENSRDGPGRRSSDNGPARGNGKKSSVSSQRDLPLRSAFKSNTIRTVTPTQEDRFHRPSDAATTVGRTDITASPSKNSPQAVDFTNPFTRSPGRIKSKNIDERLVESRDEGSNSFMSRARNRLGSTHFKGNPSTGHETAHQYSPSGSISHPDSGLHPPLKISERNDSRNRLVKAPPEDTLSVTTQSVSDSLPSPVTTSNAYKLLSLMKKTRGRMSGPADFRVSDTPGWTSAFCFINEESGSLAYRVNDEGNVKKTLVPDLRGCHVKVLNTVKGEPSAMEVSTHTSGLELVFRVQNLEQFDAWLAAFMCWQPIKPKGAQNKVAKFSGPSHKPDRPTQSRRRKSDSSTKEDVAVIKVGKLLVWDNNQSYNQNAYRGRGSGKTTKRNSNYWRSASCLLRENGELKLFNEDTVSSVIQLSQLSRCAVQRLDRSVLDEDFCIAIYPQYTSASTSISLINPIYLSLESRVIFEVWMVLLRAFTIPEVYGPSNLSNFEHASSPSSDLYNTPTKGMFRVERTLLLKVGEAKMILPKLVSHSNEKDSGEYHAEVWLDGEVRAKTFVKPATHGLVWREDFDFSDLPAVLSSTSLLVLRRDTGSSGRENANTVNRTTAMNIVTGRTAGASGRDPKDIVIGRVDIYLDDLEQGKDIEGWWPIINYSEEKIGEMFIKVQTDELLVLMSQDYQELSELLHNFSNGLTLRLAHAGLDLKRVSETLLNIFQVSGKANEWVMMLIEEEIDGARKEFPGAKNRFIRRTSSTDSQESGADRENMRRDLGKAATVEANLLFRGNSLLTKALDAHMKRVGKTYLEETLCERLKEIEEKDLDCEVDPNKVISQDELNRNWRNLLMTIKGVWSAISKSADRCPPDLRMIFRHIRDCAEDRYGDFLPSVSYSSVSGFLFLRFFCAAILNPKLFSLLKGHPGPKVQRTLTLIAKSLQGLANMTSFGIKEPWMEPMNQFLSAHRQGLKDFIDSICSYAAEESASSVPPPSYNTPNTILSRLPAVSREGFPSLPYMIDQSKNFATLVKIYTDPETLKLKESQLDGAARRFHQICLELHQRTIDSLDHADQAERPNSDLSSRWHEFIRQNDGEDTPNSIDTGGFSLFPKSPQPGSTGSGAHGPESPSLPSPQSTDYDTSDISGLHASNPKYKFSDLVGGIRRKVRRGVTPNSEDDV